MQEQPAKIALIRSLVGAQSHDAPWFTAAAEVLDRHPGTFETNAWWEYYWCQDWGDIEFVREKEQITVIWHRLDGGESLADADMGVSENIRVMRFALLACLSQSLREAEELSYVRSGYPREWARSKVYLDGREVQQVVLADAILNYVETVMRIDGRLVPTADGRITTQRSHGAVRIVLQNETQLMF